jgi:hypothetical protein
MVCLPFAVHAQDFTTRQSVMGAPQYGFDTTNNHTGAMYHTQDIVMGHPEYGRTTTGPNGNQCTTRYNVIGHPEYGTNTSC